MQVPLAFLYTVNLSVAQDQNIRTPSVPVGSLSRGSSLRLSTTPVGHVTSCSLSFSSGTELLNVIASF